MVLTELKQQQIAILTIVNELKTVMPIQTNAINVLSDMFQIVVQLLIVTEFLVELLIWIIVIFAL